MHIFMHEHACLRVAWLEVARAGMCAIAKDAARCSCTYRAEPWTHEVPWRRSLTRPIVSQKPPAPVPVSAVTFASPPVNIATL
jgi:hypothetical protein